MSDAAIEIQRQQDNVVNWITQDIVNGLSSFSTVYNVGDTSFWNC
jgi:hypothetical protein